MAQVWDMRVPLFETHHKNPYRKFHAYEFEFVNKGPGWSTYVAINGIHISQLRPLNPPAQDLYVAAQAALALFLSAR